MKKKRLKMKANLKYLILGVVDMIVLLNLPLILKEVNTVNDYRFNILVLATIFFTNVITIFKIEN